jgi:tRNA(Ile)-lysidine synthase
MIEEFRKYIADNQLFSPDEKILLGVSGGIDSMVMVHLFLRCGYEFGIAHCNFSLRGTESDEDELFVRNHAGRHEIPFYANSFDTKAYAAAKGISIQMAARELRYSWFEEIRQNHGYMAISLAHNLNDNIETFIINLVRGSGITGFAGIRPRSDNLVRPLLFATRADIGEYCEKYEVSYREDSSNTDTKYVRNKIRHLVVPVLKEINPSFENTIEETIARSAEISEIYLRHITGIKNNLLTETATGHSIKISDIAELTPLNTIVYELFREYGISRSMIPEFIKLTKSRSGSQLLTSTHRFIRNRGEILISRTMPEGETRIVCDSLEDLLKADLPAKIRVESCGEGFLLPQDKNMTCLSLNKLKFPVIIRNWQAGDTFYPLGMNKKKKLSDFFIDNKFSVPDKEVTLIMESDGKIASILGIRTDNRFRITKATTRCLIIKFPDV